jgi:hypothetical protein
MPDQRTPEQRIELIVQALETSIEALAEAEAEAARLACDVDRVGGPVFARFGYPIVAEARGLYGDLSGEAGSETSVEGMLGDARDLRDLIRLGNSER